MSGELLLEVRAEEIPARMLQPATEELSRRLFEDLTTRGLGPREVETGYTPRRLVLILKGLPAREPDREEQLMGPPARVAFDAEGKPTKALAGFAKRCGLAAEDLQRVETDKGEYLSAIRKIEGRALVEVLSELLPEVLASLHWPKNMRWGTGEGPWVRPVHGLLAILDGQVIPFDLFGVPTGNSTVGHPILSPQAFEVEGADDYRQKLAERGLEPQPGRRRERLLEQLNSRAKEAGGQLVENEDLLHRLTAMCEIPGVAAGLFESSFLELPREVLITSLKDHQSAFTVEGEDGNLLPTFLTVMDRADDPNGKVCSGNEWVVAARLEDGRFFYQEDRKASLEERMEQLAQRTFHVKLGSYADKAQRLTRLASSLCSTLGWQQETAEAEAAARLLKADLSTEMVGEFASLQGVMGGVYARQEGHPEAVWQAIYDQYLPASAEDRLPRGRVGMIAAVADRLDTLAGMFGLGLVPSGSKDPFGLRRAAQGVVRILLEGGLAIDLREASAAALELYEGQLAKPLEEVQGNLQPFLLDRVRHLLGARGLAYDEIEAALAAGSRDLPELLERTEAVHRIREQSSFRSVALSAKRIANIIKDQPEGRLDQELLEAGAEQDLHEAATHLARQMESAVEMGDFLGGLQEVGNLASTLDRFFDDVMVMVDDTALRANRIALLRSIHQTISRIAHLSELVVDKAELKEAKN